MALLRINTRPSGKQLLVFALAWLVLAGLLGWAQWTRARPTVAFTCWGLALGVPAIGAFWHEGLRLLYVGLTRATYPIGWVVSSLVLAAIYYVVLTPIGLVLRVCGHDPMQRRPQAGSYWHPRRAPRHPTGYFRQH